MLIRYPIPIQNDATMKYIIKDLLKGRLKRFVLVIELFFSFIAFFLISSLIGNQFDNHRFPLGFSYKNVSKAEIDFGAISDWNVYIQKIGEISSFLNSYPGIEAFTKFESSFFFSNGYMHPLQPLKYNEIIIPHDKVQLMYTDDQFANVLNIELVSGRWYSSEDNSSRYCPIVISENLKKEIFSEKDALNTILEYSGEKCKIIGVSRDIKQKGDYTNPDYTLFVRNVDSQNLQYKIPTGGTCNSCGTSIFIKFSQEFPISHEINLIRKVATNFAGFNLKLFSLKSIHQNYIQKTWLPLISVLAVITALFLNVLFGLFGVLWYNISQRIPEIGIRMALGASKPRIYRHFIREMLLLTTLAIIPGIVVAVQFPLFDLFEIPLNVFLIAMLASAIIIYALVTLSALLPSYRATKIQPAVALYEE